MSETNDIPPEPESAPQPDVLVVPAEFFFVEHVEVPAAVSSGELADYAELSMEGLAPFPLEQLRWGFLTAPDGQRILIYAALNDRLQRAGYKNLESYTWVLPDFATLYGARFSRETEVVLHGDGFDTACHQPQGEGLPEDIRSLPHHDGDSSAKPGNDSLHLRLHPVELTEKGLPVFKFEALSKAPSEGHWSPLEPEEASLWNADIRPAGYKSVERNARRTTAWITRALGYAAIFALGLLCLEGLYLAGQFWLGTREAKIDAQSTAVRRIEDKQSLMNKLEQVAQNELRPIAILRAANDIRTTLGKTGIEYDETVIEAGNRLTIEGKANTINELNAYTEALRKSGNFELIDTKQLTRSGKTTFTATLDYLHSEPPASEPAEAATAPADTAPPETEETAG